MFKRAGLFLAVVCLAMVAISCLASAGGVNGGMNGGLNGPASVIWGGGSPAPHGLIWGGGRGTDAPPPSHMIQRPAARPGYVYWYPHYVSGPVDHYDWSRWFDWLGNID